MEENNIQNQTEPEVPAWKDKARPAIYLLAGLYILYMAYKLFVMMNTSSGGEKILMIAFAVLFLGLGMGLSGFAIGRIMKSNKKNK